MNLKGEMSMLNVLHLEDSDVSLIAAGLKKKRHEMPQFFMQCPLVIDCDILGDAVADLDFAALKKVLLDQHFIPVGVRSIPASMHALLFDAGWAVMRENRKPSIEDKNPYATTGIDESSVTKMESTAKTPDESATYAEEVKPTTAPQAPVSVQSVTIDKPVRSGQQVYAVGSDMTVLAKSSAGSEIIADGSIHVYGVLRGRVLAGAKGNLSARIFCQSLQAELIAIAGYYQLLDESDTALKGKPAMIRLSGEKLVIEPL